MEPLLQHSACHIFQDEGADHVHPKNRSCMMPYGMGHEQDKQYTKSKVPKG